MVALLTASLAARKQPQGAGSAAGTTGVTGTTGAAAVTGPLGLRLREARLALGLRQAEAAQRAAISASYLNLIEHNRRNVSPEVLARLAFVLGLDLAALTAAPEGFSGDELRAAAASFPDVGAELPRLEEFAGRFPGWAGVIAALYRRNDRLDRALAAMSDRLGHDPHLSAALHEVLSALSGVRATAAILSETEDLSEEWRAKFHRNLQQDSERLAAGAGALTRYLDRPEALGESGLISPQAELEAWAGAIGWSVPEEGPSVGLPQNLSQAGSDLILAFIAQCQKDARALPWADFSEAMSQAVPVTQEASREASRGASLGASLGAALGPIDPAVLAARFGTDIPTVMRRIAFAPGSEVGILICDGSGALLMRKPAPGLGLPALGAVCPLWPLFQALAQPNLGIVQEVSMPRAFGAGEGMFLCQAYGTIGQPSCFGRPGQREAAMLIYPRLGTSAIAQGGAGGSSGALPIGPSCRLCPREGCGARQEPSILDGARVISQERRGKGVNVF